MLQLHRSHSYEGNTLLITFQRCPNSRSLKTSASYNTNLPPLASSVLSPIPSREPSSSESDSVQSDSTSVRMAEREWCNSKCPDVLLAYHALLFSASLSEAKSSFFQSQVQSSFSRSWSNLQPSLPYCFSLYTKTNAPQNLDCCPG